MDLPNNSLSTIFETKHFPFCYICEMKIVICSLFFFFLFLLCCLSWHLSRIKSLANCALLYLMVKYFFFSFYVIHDSMCTFALYTKIISFSFASFSCVTQNESICNEILEILYDDFFCACLLACHRAGCLCML